jgi:hypothetical protein
MGRVLALSGVERQRSGKKVCSNALALPIGDVENGGVRVGAMRRPELGSVGTAMVVAAVWESVPLLRHAHHFLERSLPFHHAL